MRRERGLYEHEYLAASSGRNRSSGQAVWRPVFLTRLATLHVFTPIEDQTTDNLAFTNESSYFANLSSITYLIRYLVRTQHPGASGVDHCHHCRPQAYRITCAPGNAGNFCGCTRCHSFLFGDQKSLSILSEVGLQLGNAHSIADRSHKTFFMRRSAYQNFHGTVKSHRLFLSEARLRSNDLALCWWFASFSVQPLAKAISPSFAITSFERTALSSSPRPHVLSSGFFESMEQFFIPD